MRAVICRAWGAVEDLTIEDVPVPTPAVDEVLIDVRATSVNYADSLMVGGSIRRVRLSPSARGSRRREWWRAVEPARRASNPAIG